MKQKKIILTVVLIAIIILGIGAWNKFNPIPTMTITSGKNSIDLIHGSASWNGTIYDASALWEDDTFLSSITPAEDNTLEIAFSLTTSKVKITRWKLPENFTSISDIDFDSITPETYENNGTTIKDASNYLYVIRGDWLFGYAEYHFFCN